MYVTDCIHDNPDTVSIKLINTANNDVKDTHYTCFLWESWQEVLSQGFDNTEDARYLNTFMK